MTAPRPDVSAPYAAMLAELAPIDHVQWRWNKVRQMNPFADEPPATGELEELQACMTDWDEAP